MADREAKDLGEWIDFAQDNNASENELMSFAGLLNPGGARAGGPPGPHAPSLRPACGLSA